MTAFHKMPYLSIPPVQIKGFEGTMENEHSFGWQIATVITFCIVLKSIATTEEPAATYNNDSQHFTSTGAPGTEVIPTQHDERTADDVVVSQTLTYQDHQRHQ